MAIPVAITTITILNPDDDDLFEEPYEGRTYVSAATGIRAVIDTPTSGAHGGRDKVAGGEQTITTLRLFCDPCPISRLSLVVDEAKPDFRYKVLWLQEYTDPTVGLDHIQGEVELVEGAI